MFTDAQIQTQMDLVAHNKCRIGYFKTFVQFVEIKFGGGALVVSGGNLYIRSGRNLRGITHEIKLAVGSHVDWMSAVIVFPKSYTDTDLCSGRTIIEYEVFYTGAYTIYQGLIISASSPSPHTHSNSNIIDLTNDVASNHPTAQTAPTAPNVVNAVVGATGQPAAPLVARKKRVAQAQVPIKRVKCPECRTVSNNVVKYTLVVGSSVECCVCMTVSANFVFPKCGHMNSCVGCVINMSK